MTILHAEDSIMLNKLDYIGSTKSGTYYRLSIRATRICTVISNMNHERKDYTALCSLISIVTVVRQLPQPEGNTCSLNKLAVADVPHKRVRSVVHVHA
jgi:hypothetical protein